MAPNPGSERRPRRGDGERSRGQDRDAPELIEKLVGINRVAKVVKGGRRFGFAAVGVVGDGKGRVGFGTGKAREVPEAIRKATEQAKRSMIRVALKDARTLHHDIEGRHGAEKVVLRTAVAGTGIIAGGPMRAVFEMLGIQDVVSAVTFTAGTKYVTNDVPAAYQVYLDRNAASPPTNDGAALGRATVSWSDLYLASGGQINWNNSTAYLYESSGNLIWNGGDFDMRKTGSSPALVTARQDTHATGIAVGSLYHKGRDSGGTAKTYAITQGYCDGNTPGSENGSLDYQIMKAGTVTDVVTMSGTAYMPTTSDGMTLGSTTKMWSDLFLASGGVIKWNNGDVTATHAANALSFAGASSGYIFDAV